MVVDEDEVVVMLRQWLGWHSDYVTKGNLLIHVLRNIDILK